MEPEDESSAREPPLDPEAWTDAQWLSWLKSTDAETAEDDAPASLASRAAHSAVGNVIGQAMLGLAKAMYGRADEELTIVTEGDGPTHHDDPFTVRLDFEHPERSSVVFTDRSDPARADDE